MRVQGSGAITPRGSRRGPDSVDKGLLPQPATGRCRAQAGLLPRPGFRPAAVQTGRGAPPAPVGPPAAKKELKAPFGRLLAVPCPSRLTDQPRRGAAPRRSTHLQTGGLGCLGASRSPTRPAGTFQRPRTAPDMAAGSSQAPKAHTVPSEESELFAGSTLTASCRASAEAVEKD